jgi:hypothetical protein
MAMPVLAGSHMDSKPAGGLTTSSACPPPSRRSKPWTTPAARPYARSTWFAWTNEEGVRFAPIAGAGSLGRSLLREGWHLSISNR